MAVAPFPRLAPPVQDAPLRPGGDQFGQAWTEHNQRMVDRLFALPIELTAQLTTGVTDGSDAETGKVGEFIDESAINVAMTTGVPITIISMALSPGDWEVSGNVFFEPDPGTDPAQFVTSISDTDNAPGQYLALIQSPSFQVGGHAAQWVGPQRFNVSAATTIYLVAQCAFTGGAMLGNGTIMARRVR